MWGLIISAVILKVSGSTSVITGVNPKREITSAVATYVNEGQITSSPGFKDKAISAIWRASVPLAQGITCLTSK